MSPAAPILCASALLLSACHLKADFRASHAGSSRRYIVRRQTSSASGRWTTKRRVSSIGFRSRDRLHGSCRGAIRQSGWRNTSREAMLRPRKCSRRERFLLKVLWGWCIQWMYTDAVVLTRLLHTTLTTQTVSRHRVLGFSHFSRFMTLLTLLESSVKSVMKRLK